MENALLYKLSTMKYITLIISIIMAEHCFGQSGSNLSQETNFYSNRFERNETYNNKKIRLPNLGLYIILTQSWHSL